MCVADAAVDADGALDVPVPAAARARGHAAQRLHGAPERSAAATAAPSRGQPPGHAAAPEATVLQRRPRRRPRWWRRPRWRRRLQRRRTAAASRRPCLTLACFREPKTVFNTETPTHVNKNAENKVVTHLNSCARTACRSAELCPFEWDNLGRK